MGFYWTELLSEHLRYITKLNYYFSANDELASLREQLDQSMDHRETLERQQFELNLKESRKRTELQRELEAKEDEMEEMRCLDFI